MALVEFKTPPQHVLIIKPSAIGDVVHALPIWNLLRRHWPQTRFSWVVTPACAGLLEGHAALELLRFDRRRLGTAWYNPRAACELVRFMRDLRQRRFDLVIDLQGLLRSAWMAWQTRAPLRIGFGNAREWGWLFYTHRVKIDSMEQHAIQRYLKVLEALGCPTAPLEFPFAVSEQDRQFIAGKLPTADSRFAVVLPGTNWRTKRWPIESFAALVGPLWQQLGLETVVAGGPGDAKLAAQIPGSMNLAGQTTLSQLVALLERAELVIANDSGPMHIAAALGRPLVTIFGPTNPVRTGPFGRMETVVRSPIHCSPCYSRRCGHLSCMRQLSVETVLAAAQAQLQAAPAPASRP